LYELTPTKYFPGLPEWGIAIGVIGYGLAMLSMGVRFLPLFGNEDHS
jgi:Ni/Fe-hydrogenase subunit HybB-like protein